MKPRRYWKNSEVRLMQDLAAEGKPQSHVAFILRRDKGNLAQAAMRYGVSFHGKPGRPPADPETKRRRMAEACRRWRAKRRAQTEPQEKGDA